MNQHIFHLSGNELIDELIEYINGSTPDNIVFLFSRKSWIFSQITDLKTLREEAEKKKKNLVIVTPNPIARTTLQSLGIQCYGSLEDMEKTPFAQEQEKSTENKPVKKIAVDPMMYTKEKKMYTKKGKSPSFLTRPSLHALLLLGTLAFFLAVFILNIAIPESTIIISPAKKEEENHININALEEASFNEADLWRKNNGLFSTGFEKTFTIKKSFTNLTKEFRGENASGTVEIYNPFHEAYTVQGGTRFVTQSGVIFITPKWLKIKANGTTTTTLEAKETDEYGKFQGETANIPKGQIMTIPGFSENIRSKIIVKNTTPMEGGKTNWVYKATEKDIQTATKELEDEVKIQAPKELEYLLENTNEAKQTDLIFFPFFTEGTTYSPQVIIEPQEIIFTPPIEELLDSEREFFEAEITVRVKNIAYSQRDIEDLIRKKFKKSSPEGMELKSIDTSLINPEVEKSENDGKEIIASVSTRGVYTYIIEPKSEKGFTFVKKASKEIAGMTKDEAKDHLINNFPEVSDVSISTWPTWVNKIPLLAENIKFTIYEE